MRLCEFRRDNDTLCGDEAAWLVSVGTRASDAQLACGVHLDPTVSAMYEAEGRRSATIQVRSPASAP